MTWILTHTGRRVAPLNVEPEDIHIEDIAHSLSHICRFNGHCRFPYSVAQHSLIVMDLVKVPELKLAALMHDATEAYVCDLPSPLKRQISEYKNIEAQVWEAIAIKYGLPLELPAIIKKADLIALATEKRDLMPKHPEPWDCLKNIEPSSIEIKQISPAMVKVKFLEHFNYLREIK
jgi:5'-deoxynucleotidase YfbR-like HD superfamily hydrolase